jgi:hypothetical protein
MDAREIHEMEQAFAALRTLAGMVRRYFVALTEEGFNPVEALALTRDFQSEQVRMILSRIGKKEEG